MLYYPENFPQDKEKLLIAIFKELLNKNPSSLVDLKKAIRNFLKNKKVDGFFPSFWMLNFVYWRHFSANTPLPDFFKFLKKTQIRSLSGIVPLSLFTTNINSCPFNCLYCATEKGSPKSYFSDEAAVKRAIRNKFDPFKQTMGRLIQFFLSGHPIDKVDIIIQGGTFSIYDQKYREEFVRQIFLAANLSIKDIIVNGVINKKNLEDLSFARLKEINVKSEQRIVGITIETRPDFICEKEILFLRHLGVTRVEMGVQSTSDEVLKINKRGHLTKEVIKATSLLKEAGFKITYHLMPGLYGSSFIKDIESLREVFANPNFKPDAIKFYPTQVVFHSELYELYKQGKYTPLTEEELIKMNLIFKSEIVPKWVRIQRLVRDLTKNDVAVVSFPSNFRQKLVKVLNAKKIKCKCIRCREIMNKKIFGDFKINIEEYEAVNGKEYFIEAVDLKEQLLGYLRLRIPEFVLTKKSFFIKSLEESTIIRELHVCGQQASIGKKGQVQHLGIGKALISEAEKITKENNLFKIAVISGVGVRDYYRNLGYSLVADGEYMVKKLN